MMGFFRVRMQLSQSSSWAGLLYGWTPSDGGAYLMAFSSVPQPPSPPVTMSVSFSPV